MKYLDWDDFRLFAAVARHGNFTRAARELNTSEPTISRRIKRLEQRIGVKLFDRREGVPRLTQYGQRALNHAAAAEYAIAQAASISEEETEYKGEVKILAGDGIGSYWLPQFLPAFMEEHQDINVVLYTTQERAMPKQAPFDLLLQYMDTLSPDAIRIRLGTLHFTLFASRRYIQANGAPPRLKDLAHHRVLDLSFDLTEKGTLASWAGLQGHPAVFTNSNAVIGEVVRYGGGIALLPTYATVLEEEVVPVLPEFNLTAPVFLAFTREIGDQNAVRATINYLRDVVFDRKAMPWFREEYVPPSAEWSGEHAEYLARLRAGRGRRK